MDCACGLFLLIAIILGITEMIYLILEHMEINSEFNNFRSHSLEKKTDSQGNVTYHNFGEDDYPCKVVQDKYLCNISKSLTSDKLICAYDNPEQIKEDLANHSEKWINFYTCLYIIPLDDSLYICTQSSLHYN